MVWTSYKCRPQIAGEGEKKEEGAAAAEEEKGAAADDESGLNKTKMRR